MSLTPHDLVVEAKARVREVPPAEARAFVAAGAAVLDVREPEEYNAGHLPGAINIPRGILEFRIGMVPQFQHREQAILVYCKTSGRAALSGVQLQRLGYTAISSLAGGFDHWSSQNLPIDKPQPISYE